MAKLLIPGASNVLYLYWTELKTHDKKLTQEKVNNSEQYEIYHGAVCPFSLNTDMGPAPVYPHPTSNHVLAYFNATYLIY